MRSLAYGVAVLAAVGMMLAIANIPRETSDEPSVAQSTLADAASADQVTSGDVMQEAGSLTLHVPDMHCPFACYPAIKKTLEESATVQQVELAEQKVEGTIDNPQVIINFNEGFDVNAAIAALKAKGFDNSSVVQ
jgi:hypothetical protein